MERRQKAKAFVDLFVVLALIFALSSLRWWTRPVIRGYFEDDNSIRYPFIFESVPLGVLGGVGGAVLFLTIVVTEAFRHKLGLYPNNVMISGRVRKEWLFQVASYLSVYLYGLFSSLIIVYLGKYALGRLRPHFIDVCRPNVLNDSWSAAQNSLGYIISYSCTGWSWFRIENARTSFPSTHASFAMYTTIFFILYLEKKAKWHVTKALRHLVQFGAVLATWYVGSTRLVENWSHWSDVAAGYLIGGVFAVSFFYHNFVSKKQKKQEQNSLLPNTQQPINVSVVNQQPTNVLSNQQPTDQPPQYQLNIQAQPKMQTNVDVKVSP